MSRYRKNKVVKKDNEEIQKAVFELYKPNKFQEFTMRAWGLNNPFSGNKARVASLSGVLNLTTEQVLELEKKYYIM